MTRPDPHASADQGVVITISILNASSADLTVADGQLTGGAWRGPPPTPGATLSTGPTTFVNTGQSPFSQVGGYIILTPAGGGSITLSWSWTRGVGLEAYGSVGGTSSLLLTYDPTNVSSFHPTVTYTITEPGAERACR